MTLTKNMNVPERTKIKRADIEDLSTLGFSTERIATMDLKEADYILFSRLRATEAGE